MKPYQQVMIADCGEPLVPIPVEVFARVTPHPYEKLGAPYGSRSPFYVRQDVLDRLFAAQHWLQRTCPNWKILIFDAYRPLEVQQFMVDYAFAEEVERRGLTKNALTEQQRQEITQLMQEFWAVPNPDPAKPPPHSTGGAIDVTLVDETGQPVDMGSPIDELSPRSYPNHFANSLAQPEQTFHQNRELLRQAMTQAGFMQHWGEWWHFCYGDQMWAWLKHQVDNSFPAIARYGRVL